MGPAKRNNETTCKWAKIVRQGVHERKGGNEEALRHRLRFGDDAVGNALCLRRPIAVIGRRSLAAAQLGRDMGRGRREARRT